MKVAQKQRGTARFRRYELVSVSKFRNGGAIPPVSEGLFWCLVFGALLPVRTGVLPCRHDPRPHRGETYKSADTSRTAAPFAMLNPEQRAV
jgi:hypothetical protein